MLMFSRVVLLTAGMLIAAGALAQDNPRFSRALFCQAQTTLMRKLALQSDFDLPPAINALMVNVIDGKLPQVRQQLAAMSKADAARWRQSALIIATYASRPTVVAGLLDDGAAVNGKGEMPDLKCSFRNQAIADVKNDPVSPPNPRPGSTEDFEEAAVLWFNGGLDGPALSTAIECGDAATVDVVLRQHPDVMLRPAPDVVDPLESAIVQDNAVIVKQLLDHGANPCVGDRSQQRLAAAYHAKHPRQKIPLVSYAELGRRQKLPDDLITRLNCPAFDKAH